MVVKGLGRISFDTGNCSLLLFVKLKNNNKQREKLKCWFKGLVSDVGIGCSPSSWDSSGHRF